MLYGCTVLVYTDASKHKLQSLSGCEKTSNINSFYPDTLFYLYSIIYVAEKKKSNVYDNSLKVSLKQFVLIMIVCYTNKLAHFTNNNRLTS